MSYDLKLVETVARALVASDFAKSPAMGPLTELRWQDMLRHWRSLAAKPKLRAEHQVENAMRRAKAAFAAIDASGTHWVAPSWTLLDEEAGDG